MSKQEGNLLLPVMSTRKISVTEAATFVVEGKWIVPYRKRLAGISKLTTNSGSPFFIMRYVFGHLLDLYEESKWIVPYRKRLAGVSKLTTNSGSPFLILSQSYRELLDLYQACDYQPTSKHPLVIAARPTYYF